MNTSDIVKNAIYFEGGNNFFNQFEQYWKDCKDKVLKIETRQDYIDVGESYAQMRAGNLNNLLELIKRDRAVDEDLYINLKDKNVPIIRCRPIKYPLSQYMQWELQVYKINKNYGEVIFVCDADMEEVRFLMTKCIHHDFVVFDNLVGLVHHYNENGKIVGGWKIYDKEKIAILAELFYRLKNLSKEF